eukprot:CAMPEP_0117538652 /NCGR_PEP_ID=MMETSP0784-20121206/42588_1 /TAXON_ID=39447 /ORGANISM="" /LENGTH=151 /DNA_ID=CAMNT_0005335271 /DNA_START=222 /DNA_END=677 /DNA_ORIENTATION=-
MRRHVSTDEQRLQGRWQGLRKHHTAQEHGYVCGDEELPALPKDTGAQVKASEKPAGGAGREAQDRRHGRDGPGVHDEEGRGNRQGALQDQRSQFMRKPVEPCSERRSRDTFKARSHGNNASMSHAVIALGAARCRKHLRAAMGAAEVNEGR